MRIYIFVGLLFSPWYFCCPAQGYAGYICSSFLDLWWICSIFGDSVCIPGFEGLGGDVDGTRPLMKEGGCNEAVPYGVVEGIGVGARDGRT